MSPVPQPPVFASRPLTIEDVVRLVAEYYSYTPATIRGDGRGERLVEARSVAAYLARHELEASYPEIGRMLAKHHTTIMSAVKRIETLLGAGAPVAEHVHGLRAFIRGQKGKL